MLAGIVLAALCYFCYVDQENVIHESSTNSLMFPANQKIFVHINTNYANGQMANKENHYNMLLLADLKSLVRFATGAEFLPPNPYHLKSIEVKFHVGGATCS